MLRVYYIPISNDNYVIYDQADILDNLLPFRIQWIFWSDIMEYDNQSNNMLDNFTLGDTNQWNTNQCYFISNSPYILDWSKSYMNDNGTDVILKNIQKSKKREMDCNSLKSYQTRIQDSPKISKDSDLKWEASTL